MTCSESRIVVRVLGTLSLMAMLLSLGAGAIAAPPDQGGGLFADVAVEGYGAPLDDPKIVRTRLVEPNFALLGGTDDAPAADVLTLNLFDDVTFTAVLDRAESNPSGSLSWMGHLEGVEYGSVALVVKDGVMVGSVNMPGAFYEVHYVGDGVHAIQEMDKAAFPTELEPVPATASKDALVEGLSAPTADDGSIIDVLVVYTDDARIGEGGTTAIQNRIDLAIAETNTSYANSNVNQRVNLVHTAEVSYDESGFNWSTTLGRLQTHGDGYFDNVTQSGTGLRDTYCADEVVLLVEDDAYCGLAYLMDSVSPTFESYAFALVHRGAGCATGYYSFGHEMGHNMGVRHDWYVDDAATPYTYAHGYVNAPDRWRTIMAYNTDCYDQGFNCDRLQYWSNPNVLYGGDPMGVPGGTSTSCTAGTHNPNCDADSHLVLNNTAYTVANFRDSAACGATAGPLVYDSHTVDDDTVGESNGNDDGIVNCGESIELYVDLYNQGSSTATGVNATISSSDPYITFTYNTSSGYPNIAGLGTGTNSDDFDFDVAPETPPGHSIQFDLDITASEGGPWSDSFNVTVICGLDYIVYLPLVMKVYPPIPATPVLNPISNPDGDGNYTVSWSAADRANTYTLQEDDNPSFSSPTTRYNGSGTFWNASGKPNGTYYYRVRANNSWGSSGWSDVRSVRVQPLQWVTILSENFEGSFPGSTWTVRDNDPDSGRYYWGKRNCIAHGGSYSAWSAGAGDSTISCGDNYRNDMYAWMIYGPFSLADATAAELTFDWWSDTELCCDIFFWGASINGDNYYGTSVRGNWASWTTGQRLDLSSVPTLGNLLGRNQVWIAFVFGSDYSITDKGSFVDDVLLRKQVGGSASQSLPSSQWILQPDQAMEFVRLRLSQGDLEPLLEEPR